MSVDVLVMRKLHPLLMNLLEQHHHIHKYWEASDPETLLQECGQRVRIVVTSASSAFGARKALIDRLPALEMISVHGVGYDAVDIETAKQRGIVVTNTPGLSAASVAELTVTLMLTLARRVCAADKMVRTGAWSAKNQFPLGTTLHGKICGIVGMGHIGQAVAQLVQALGMVVHYTNRTPKPDLAYHAHPDLLSLATAADFLVLCVAGGAGTQHMINQRVLAALGTKGTLINVARGSAVDEPALVKALQQGTIAGAGLDVYAREPHVPSELFSMDNVLLSPHLGSATVETRQAMAQLTFDNMQAYLSGGPVPNRVA